MYAVRSFGGHRNTKTGVIKKPMPFKPPFRSEPPKEVLDEILLRYFSDDGLTHVNAHRSVKLLMKGRMLDALKNLLTDESLEDALKLEICEFLIGEKHELKIVEQILVSFAKKSKNEESPLLGKRAESNPKQQESKNQQTRKSINQQIMETMDIEAVNGYLQTNPDWATKKIPQWT